MIFAQMCTLYHQGKVQVQSVSHTSNSSQFNSQQSNSFHVTTSQVNFHPTQEDLSPPDAILGQVWVGNLYWNICIPANSVKVIQGKTSKSARQLSCMIEARSQNNLPMGVMVNHTAVTPTKSKRVPITLMKMNSYNVWIQQPLLAADIVEVDHCPWDYHSTMSCDGGEVQVSFSPVPTPDVQADVISVDVTEAEIKVGETDMTKGGEQGEMPKFGPRPKFNSKDFDFKQELVRLPFPVNIGEVELSLSQQKHFLELVYDHQSVFSLCDEDLSLCD